MITRPATPANARPRPRRRALTVLAAAAPLLLLASQLRLLPQDDGVLLAVAGRPIDAAGAWQARWQRLVRDCSGVRRWPAGSATWLMAQQALAAHSPPASHGARPVQLLEDASGDWLLAEVLWDNPAAVPATAATGASAPLDPAIVPLRRSTAGMLVQTTGVWSGDTGPWQAPVFIRRWLRQQVPGLPAALPLCLDPQWPAFAG